MNALVFAQPLWLAAGAVALLVPIVLHLIAPRPPARAPLPTARFVEPQARARRYLSRRPRDPLLLALRCLFLALLFCALAGPRIAPPRSGTADILLIDPAADDTIVETARTGSDLEVVTDSFAGFADVLARLPRAAFTDTRADSVRVTWIAPFSQAGWTPGTTTMRAAWPGAIALVEAPLPTADTTTARGTAAVLVEGEAGRAIELALEALGYDFGADAAAAGVVVSAGPLPQGATREGATIIAVEDTGDDASLALFADGITVRDIAGSAIALAGDERVLATWDDGDIAAVVAVRDGRCMVRTGIDLRHPATRTAPELPELLRLLASGCAKNEPNRALPLGDAARTMLAGAGLPAAVAVASLPGSDVAGVALARWLLLTALVVAAAETLVAARRDRGTTRASPGTPRA